MKLLSPLRIALLVLLLATVAAGFLLIPEGRMLPVHWGIDGEADRFAPRELALLVPVIIAALAWAILAIALRLAGASDRERSAGSIGVVLTALTGLALLLAAVIVLMGIGVGVNAVRTLSVGIGLLLLALGWALPTTEPNTLAGIRMAATMLDPANWQATHRLTGRLYMAAGVILVLAALVAPTSLLVWWLLGAAVLPALIGVAYSLAFASRNRR